MGTSRISLKKHGATLLLFVTVCAFSSMYAYMSRSRVMPMAIVMPVTKSLSSNMRGDVPGGGLASHSILENLLTEAEVMRSDKAGTQSHDPKKEFGQGRQPEYKKSEQTKNDEVGTNLNIPSQKANINIERNIVETNKAINTGQFDQSIAQERVRLKEKNPIEANNRRVTQAIQNMEGSGRIPVLVLTYMRSGSSLTGNILEIHDEVFYVFEPFKLMYKSPQLVHFINGTFRKPKEYTTQQLHAEALRGWLNCNFSSIPTNIFNDPFMSYGKKTKDVRQCLSRVKEHVPLGTQKEERVKCILELQEQCRRSKFVVVKTIRTRMTLALREYPNINNMKIVHLIRDPRATMNSQSHRNVCPAAKGGLIGCAKTHCQRVTNDTRTKDQSVAGHSGSIYTLKYEDLATNPVNTTHALYKFIGLTFNDSVAKIVYTITLGGDRRQCKICQQSWQIGSKRDSSAAHINSWKTAMSSVTISNIEMYCRSVILHYGYRLS